MSKRIALLALGLALLGGMGCSGHAVNENDPASLFQDAEEDVKSDHYQIAIDKFRQIKNRFPYSKFSADAQLRIADIYFLQESYPEAAAAYEAFRDLHPKHEKVAYAAFRAAKSYFMDTPSPIDRDLTPATKSQTAYNDFLHRFPDDPQTEEARRDIATIRKLLADKELLIGDFYYHRSFFDSARPRYEKVLSQYPETAAAKEAERKLSEISKMRRDPASSGMTETGPSPDRQIQQLIARREFTQAEILIQDRLRKAPENPDAHYLLGVTHFHRGQIGQSVECLKRVLSLDPRHTDAAISLSVLLNDIGKYDEARKVFEQANQSIARRDGSEDMGIDRKFAVKHLELADLYFRYRRYDEAIEEYGKAAALDPTTPDIRIRRAKAYAKKGFLTRAMQELQQLKRERPDFIPARIQLGLLHYSQGNVLDAELEWESVMDLEPAHREARAYLEMARQARVK